MLWSAINCSARDASSVGCDEPPLIAQTDRRAVWRVSISVRSCVLRLHAASRRSLTSHRRLGDTIHRRQPGSPEILVRERLYAPLTPRIGEDAFGELVAIDDTEELCRRLMASPRGWGRSTRHTEAVELLAEVQGGLSSTQPKISTAELDPLPEEATVDCYNDEEQITALFTMIEEHLAVPFQTTVLGMTVTVIGVDLMG